MRVIMHINDFIILVLLSMRLLGKVRARVVDMFLTF